MRVKVYVSLRIINTFSRAEEQTQIKGKTLVFHFVVPELLETNVG